MVGDWMGDCARTEDVDRDSAEPKPPNMTRILKTFMIFLSFGWICAAVWPDGTSLQAMLFPNTLLT
jgi:hypothetical protein